MFELNLKERFFPLGDMALHALQDGVFALQRVGRGLMSL